MPRFGAEALTSDRRLLALDRAPAQRGDHRVGRRLRHLDQREAVGDLDRADLPSVQAGLVRDRADEVLRADATLAPDGDGGTWLTLTMRYRPALGVVGRGLDWALLRWLQARRLSRALEAIARLARPAPGPTAVP